MLRKKNVDQWNNAMTSGCTDIPDWKKKKINEHSFFLLFSKEDFYTEAEKGQSRNIFQIQKYISNPEIYFKIQKYISNPDIFPHVIQQSLSIGQCV